MLSLGCELPIKRFAIWLVLLAAALLLLVASQVILDAYYIPRAERAVAVASRALARGEVPANFGFYPEVDRSALRRAFSCDWRISGYDAIGWGPGGYEIKVRVVGDGQYNFDASHSNGSWQLMCCGHWSEEDIRERETRRRCLTKRSS